MDKQEIYLNCLLFGTIEKTQGRDGVGYCVGVYPEDQSPESEMLFYESTFMSGTAIAIRHDSRQSTKAAIQELERLTFSKARARIALEKYEIGERYEQNIYSNSEQEKSDIEDDDIQVHILKALLNIRKKCYQTYKSMKIDVDGFCYLLKISKKQFIFNADILLEDGLVDNGDVEELYVENGGINITSKGIRYLPKVPDNAKKKLQSKTKKVKNKNHNSKYKYDVAISFAGSERELAEELASIIKNAGYEVFYDKDKVVELWGKDLAIEFDNVFRKESKYCVVFISDEYSKRIWTRHEIRSALSCSISERGKEYILPIKVDDTDIPGLQPTTGYLSLDNYTIDEIGEILIKKLQDDNIDYNSNYLKNQI